MSATTLRGRFERWGVFERFLVVFTLATMLALQILLIGEVFSDAGSEFTAAVSAAYNILGALVIYLILTIFGDFGERQLSLSLRAGLPERYAPVFRSLIWVLAAGAMAWTVLDSNTTIQGSPELSKATTFVSVGLVAVLGLRAVPKLVWKRLYSWWPFRTAGVLSP